MSLSGGGGLRLVGVSTTSAGGDATVIAMGVLGATHTLNLASAPRVQATGLMSAACTLTITGLTAGCEAFLAITPDSVDRVLTISGNAITIPAADALVGVAVRSTDGAALLIDPGATDGTNGTNWFTSAGVPGTITGAVTGDFCIDRANGEVYKSTSGNSTWADQGFSLQGVAWVPPILTVTQSATPAINTDSCRNGFASITGLAQAITSMTTNLTGTPVDGQNLIIRITDDGTGRAITWGAKFTTANLGPAFPTTTVASAILRCGFMWNTVSSTWDLVAVS